MRDADGPQVRGERAGKQAVAEEVPLLVINLTLELLPSRAFSPKGFYQGHGIVQLHFSRVRVLLHAVHVPVGLLQLLLQGPQRRLDLVLLLLGILLLLLRLV